MVVKTGNIVVKIEDAELNFKRNSRTIYRVMPKISDLQLNPNNSELIFECADLIIADLVGWKNVVDEKGKALAPQIKENVEAFLNSNSDIISEVFSQWIQAVTEEAEGHDAANGVDKRDDALDTV